jgi:hypothetical protein
MPKLNKYIEFVPNIQPHNTKIWSVINIKSRYLLGYIRWYPFWREYCFFPQPKRVFSASCQQEIVNFILEHKDERIEVEKTHG